MKLDYPVEEYCAHCMGYSEITESVSQCDYCGRDLIACNACVIGDTFELSCAGCENGSKFKKFEAKV